MTLDALARRYGVSLLVSVAACLCTWLLLALLRAPFSLIARVLAAACDGVDARMTDRITTATTRPRRTR